VKKPPRKIVKKQVAKPRVSEKLERSATPPFPSNVTPRPPGPPALAAVPVSATSGDGSSLLPLLLGIALGLSVLLVALTAAPPWMWPEQLVMPVYEHRETVMLSALAAATSIGLGLAIALLGS
jgi:hypothetical protein